MAKILKHQGDEITLHVKLKLTGGKTYYPLDENARIIASSTSRFAKIITHKYASGSAREVSEDLAMNHGRTVARSFLQNVVNVIGDMKDDDLYWIYCKTSNNARVVMIKLQRSARLRLIVS